MPFIENSPYLAIINPIDSIFISSIFPLNAPIRRCIGLDTLSLPHKRATSGAVLKLTLSNEDSGQDNKLSLRVFFEYFF